MACLYWIRHQDHTDVFTQGYVGVTKYSAESRFKEHVVEANRKKNKSRTITNAIHKYGSENLIVETLVIADVNYCYELEIKLRPIENLGWNRAIGGNCINFTPPKKTPEQRAVLSEITKKWWKDNPGRCQKNKGRPQPSDQITPELHKIMTINRFYNLPNKSEIWADAEFYYADFVEGLTYNYAANRHNLKKEALRDMWKRFKAGWNPSEDERWMQVVNNKLKEAQDVPQTSQA